MQKDALDAIISQARGDALRYFNEFVSPDPQIADLLMDGAVLARGNCGVLPSSKSATRDMGQFVRRCRKRGVPLSKVERLMYPTEKSLIPYMILITYALAANVDSVSLMRLDCMTSFVNPILGRRRSIKLEKPRSGDIPPYSVAERGTLSTPWLIDAVQQMNKFIRPYATPEDSNFLFLCVTGQGNIRVLHAAARWDAFRRYIRDQCPSVPATTAMRMFRPTRAIHDYERHRDPWRTKELLHHINLSTTIPYLDNIVSREVDEVLVADTQATMLNSVTRSQSTGDAALPASLPSHTCKEPESSIHGHDNAVVPGLFEPKHQATLAPVHLRNGLVGSHCHKVLRLSRPSPELRFFKTATNNSSARLATQSDRNGAPLLETKEHMANSDQVNRTHSTSDESKSRRIATPCLPIAS